jgi:hypothetical protein
VNKFFLQLTAQAENLLYGHLEILANECGLKYIPFLNGHLQHGWKGSDIFSTEVFGSMRAKKYMWSAREANYIRSAGGGNVTVIGAPWLYLLRQKNIEHENNYGSNGIIAYPDHSQPWIVIDNNIHFEYSDYLKNEFGKVTVSLHSKDFTDTEIKQCYENDGHVVVTNGVGTPWLPDFNPNYLENQLNFLSSHRTLVSNQVSTPVFYGLSLGLDVKIGGPIGWDSKLDFREYYGNFELKHWTNKIDSLKERRALWRDELGFSHLLPKNELLAALGWNEFLLKPRLKFFYNRFQDILLNGNYKEKFSFISK